MDVDQIVGIISRRDVLHLGFGYEYAGREDVELGMFDMLQADQVMVRSPAVASSDLTVAEVANMLAETGMLALPVVNTNGSLVGTVDINDVLLFLLR